MSKYGRLINSLEATGEQHFKEGKPIDSFYNLKLKHYTDQLRGAYETGWRRAKQQSLKRQV